MTPAELAALSAYQQEQERSAAQNQPQGGGILDTLGKVALGAGLAGAALYGAKHLGGTVDLSGVNLGGIRRKLSGFVAPKGETPGTPPPSRPAPPSAVERLKTAEDVERIARAERPQGVSLVDTERRRMYARIEEPPVGWEQGARRIRQSAPTSSAASRKEVYEAVAAKPDEAVPFVSIPGMEPDVRVTLTDPRTGEIFKSGKSPESFKETYVKLHGTPGTFAEFSQEASALQKEVNTAQAAAQSDFGPQQYLKSQQYVEADNLVDQHQVKALGRIDQTVNAIDTAEDQMTGRVRQQLQRNEDVNLSAVDQIEDVTNNIDVAASQFEDGLPVDQAERLNIRTQGIDLRTGERFPLASERPYRGGLQPGMQLETETQAPSKGMEAAQKFLTSERAEIASQLGEQGLPATASRVEAELANRLSGPKAWEYGPEYTQRKQALQLGATYDPDLLESVATGVKPSGEVTIAGETVPVSSLREPVAMEETAQRLQERVAQKKDWLGNIRLQEQQKQISLGNEIERLAQEDITLGKEINSLLNIPKTFASPEAARQASSQRALAEVALDRQDIIDSRIDQLQKELFSSAARVSGAEKSTQKQIQDLALPQKLKSGIEEGQRVYFEQDPVTGAPIPGTQELRSERYAIETEAKRGGGRQVVEYDPLGQSGQEKDVYGTRLSTALTDDPTQRPTKTGPSRQPLTQPVTPQGLRSVDVTRDIMRIEKSAPPEKARQMVAEYLRKLQG